MKRLFTVTALGAGLFLGACTPADLPTIQAATVRICGFLPTAVMVANLFPTPFTIPAETVAQSICDAVAAQVPPTTTKAARLKGAAHTVSVTVANPLALGTIQVTGHFVR